MQVDTPRGVEYPAELREPRRHHGEVGHHVGGPEDLRQGLDGFTELAPGLDHLIEVARCFVAPVPGVLEGLHLGGGFPACRRLEKHVVVLARLERWVEVDQVHALVADVLA